MLTEASAAPALDPEEFPTVECYRLNVLAKAVHSGLDISRLQAYRLAVKAGLYTDEVR
jgi:hypothetical protein